MFFPMRQVPIPPVLHSDVEERPFEHCLHCERPLLDGSTPYLIEKAYRRIAAYGATEVIFEYAMCAACYGELWTKLSDTSRQRMDAYFDAHFDVEARLARLRDADPADLAPWLDTCLITGASTAGLSEYQLVGQCLGDRLVLSHIPAAIGGPALEALSGLLSQETKDELGGFMDDHFGLPPELRSLFPDRAPLLI